VASPPSSVVVAPQSATYCARRTIVLTRPPYAAMALATSQVVGSTCIPGHGPARDGGADRVC
jgi:hypothetical protein